MLPSIRALIVAGFVSFVSNWQFGYQITYVNTASDEFYDLYQHSLELNDSSTTVEDWPQKWSFVVSSFYPGSVLGFVAVPILVNKVGVRAGMTYASIPAVFGCLLMIFVQNFIVISPTCLLGALMTGRFMTGMQSGCALCLLPLFFHETCDKERREFIVALQQVFQAVSTLIGFLCGTNIIFPPGYIKVIWLQIIGLLPSLLGLIFFTVAPRTPKYIIEHMTSDEAYESELYKSARFYQGPDAEDCILGMKSEVAGERTKPAEVRDSSVIKSDIKGAILGFVAAISFGFTGDDLVDSYSTEFLYSHSKSPEAAVTNITLLMGVVLIICSVIGAFLLDEYGNRKVIVYGLVGTAIANALTSLGSSIGNWVITATGMIMTKSFIGLGAGAPAWFLSSELVSERRASLAQTISTGSLLMVVGLLTSVFLSVDQLIPSWSLLLITSLPASICAVILYLFLPETKGVSPDQIYPLLNANFLSGLKAPPERSYGSISTSGVD
ncbi:unnamed protein product [Bursaphelenchus okinawaensis]|uniref:Major facilitator superfamily (MFS) profile domain-containing protein n=1 Tax=Bursaphelenchus okinawaensis TaxID=465554 RepID=A0A811LPZ1_9BILA|nr:unnamed protein product [Bursaphelenchus okinawaensis]CAG9125301.1 unnamed protein product [Bursaphelenchus okinawaensis]